MKFLIVTYSVLFLSCQSTPPENLDYNKTKWKTYINHRFGFKIKYPAYYRVHEYREEVIFRYDNFPVLLVRSVSNNSRKKDWLWKPEDANGNVIINGETWNHYLYNHCDGPYCMRTLAYVSMHREKEIGVEFRTNKKLDQVQQEILESFRLL